MTTTGYLSKKEILENKEESLKLKRESEQISGCKLYVKIEDSSFEFTNEFGDMEVEYSNPYAQGIIEALFKKYIEEPA